MQFFVHKCMIAAAVRPPAPPLLMVFHSAAVRADEGICPAYLTPSCNNVQIFHSYDAVRQNNLSSFSALQKMLQ